MNTLDMTPETSLEDVKESASEAAVEKYQTGFGNEFETEAIAGALPIGQNSPQQLPLGLVSELVSATTFSAARAFNRRTYMFRARPSANASRLTILKMQDWQTPPLGAALDPNDYAWTQFARPKEQADFVDGMHSLCGNGSPTLQLGMSMHVYLINRSMVDTAFSNADGEMLIIPEQGSLRVVTELGVLVVGPGALALIPKGIKIRVELKSDWARGFVCENYGAPFRLPDLGLLGSNALANAADFQAPVAAYEVREHSYRLLHKFGGNLWTATLDHSPFDVVAWRGTLAPFRYDMHRFAAIGTATFDHPDPSVYCALTSPSDAVTGPNADFMVLPPRWIVAEHTLRVPGFHRNCVTEFAGFLGAPDGPDAIGSMLHNNWVPHGPGAELFERSRCEELSPQKITGQPGFMVESRFPMGLTEYAMNAPEARPDYINRWGGFKKSFVAR